MPLERLIEIPKEVKSTLCGFELNRCQYLKQYEHINCTYKENNYCTFKEGNNYVAITLVNK